MSKELTANKQAKDKGNALVEIKLGRARVRMDVATAQYLAGKLAQARKDEQTARINARRISRQETA